MIYDGQLYKDLNMEHSAVESMDFLECRFEHCAFTELWIKHCRFKECKFSHCVIINLGFVDVDATNCEFEDCILIGLNWNDLMREGYVFLPFSLIKRCKLKYHGFYDLNLKGFDFSDCHLEGCFFERCNLENCNFSGCNLTETQFINNNLSKSDFSKAKDYHIALDSNQLKKAKFSYPEVVQLLESLDLIIE